MRYKRNPTKTTPDGKLVYRSKFYKPIPLKDDDIYIVTQDGDRLDSISHQFYGDSRFWWVIAAVNNIHTAPLGIEPGLVLRIPKNHIEVLNII
jgi:hypothetical protein